MQLPSLIALMLLLVLALALPAQAASLSPAAAAAWQQWLVPLPKEVALTGKVTVPLLAVHGIVRHEPTELDQCLLQEAQADLLARAGIAADTPAQPAQAEFVFARTPAAGQALAGKRNADQGYLITTSEANGVVTVTCDALTEVGNYSGMKTLKQLLLATLRGQGAAATVDIPLGRILDWPDMEERGQWGGTCVQDLERLSDLKFNLIELHAKLTVDKEGVPHATMDEKTMERARRHAVRIVPIIHHLEQLVGTGMFDAYPQLKAVDAPSNNPQ
ncbi:MAG: glycoside hydrolase family 20 zincin-like fold domain-containing protein, partial [Armatimonadetes bacterium]|nr:glycoside hydrolase family 20 zincin-like fold domain-containing protein [Armatimonadota bacterium]